MNDISFTKLGTVKSNYFELTYDDFFKKMVDLIFQDSENNYVTYDEKNGYQIVFNGEKYNVKYGNTKIDKTSNIPEIVNGLEKLVNLSSKKREKQEKHKQELIEQEARMNILEGRREEIIENGEKGIFKSDEDKEVFISYLQHKVVDIGKIIVKGIREDAVIFTNLMCSLMVFFGVCFLGATCSEIFKLTVAWTDILKLTIVGNIIVLPPFNYNQLIKSNGLDIRDIIANRKLKKQIKALKKSLEISKVKKGNEKKNIKALELSKTVDKIKQEVINNQPIIIAVSSEFKKLRDKIHAIKNEKNKKEYAEELLSILGQYKTISNETEGNIHQKILDQLVSLTFRVDDTLKEETRARESQEEFKKMIEEVDKKSRRVSGGV